MLSQALSTLEAAPHNPFTAKIAMLRYHGNENT
jgi:hypothetical protein